MIGKQEKITEVAKRLFKGVLNEKLYKKWVSLPLPYILSPLLDGDRQF